ncbi:MAG TPA: ABC transporter permease [Candidatus Acidoferrales bacterium]
MGTLMQDAKFALRMLRKSPGFTVIAILTLALGIGANTAVFTVVNSILLRPLPYPESQRLATLRTIMPMFPEFRLGDSAANVSDIRAQNDVFEGLAMFREWPMNLSGDGDPVQARVVKATPDIFALLGAVPQQGRLFTGAEDALGKEDVAVISDALWRTRYGADPKLIGRALRLDGKLYNVVGITAPGFEFEKTEIWVPLALTPKELADRAMDANSVFVRLKSGVPLVRARAEMDAIATRFSKEYPSDDKDIKFTLALLQEDTTGNARPALLVLMGAVALVLLIGCANVGSLALARSLTRQKEVAVRAALGASRGRILRQFFVESLVLALFGGAAGWALGVYGVEAFRHLAPADTPRLADLRMDYGVFAFTLGISVLAAVLFGLAPALQSSRTEVGGALKESGPVGSTGTRSRQRVRSALVVLEVSLALVLLASSALLIKSLLRLTHVDPGFRTDHLLTAAVSLPPAKYSTEARKSAFLNELMERMKSLPAEGSAAANTSVLNGGLTITILNVEGPQGAVKSEQSGIETMSITRGFFRVMRIPFVLGRDFSAEERQGAPRAAIVNESFVRRYFPNSDPIGKRLNFNIDPNEKPDWDEIVGVVQDVRDVELVKPPRPEIFLPLERCTADSFSVFVRTQSNPRTVVPALRSIVQTIDPDLPLTEVGTMDETVYARTATPRFRSILLTVFAGLGLLLSLIGIYGVIAITVAQQTREIGIRMALGAHPADVMRLVLRRGMLWVAAGTVAGLVGAYAATRLLESLLYEVKATDAASFAIATALLVASAIAACYIPARRAMRVDPMVALRYE